MSYSPFPETDLPATSPGPPVFIPPNSPVRTEIREKPDAEGIYSRLREVIAAGTQDLDTILGAIAVAAHCLTDSSGAAIAMRREGAFVCLGRSGDTAPMLGARLGVDSGVSGECLRTGKILRCDDTRKDYRADPEVCRQLGLRSIAAVPLGGQHETVGILEAFSTQPYAFTEEHMQFLVRLAGLAEMVDAPESDMQGVAAPELHDPEAHLTVASSALARIRHGLAERFREKPETDRRQRYWAISSGVAALLLLSVVAWRILGKPASRTAASQAHQPSQVVQTQTTTAKTEGQIAGIELPWKPNPGRPLSHAGTASPSGVVQQASAIEAVDVVSRRENLALPLSSGDTAAETATQPSPSPMNAPSIAAASDATEITTLLSTPVTLPEFRAVISQGLSGGVLVHRVQPTYPPQAFSVRLQGDVVLQTTIAEDGTTRDFKVVSGSAVLARAAVDAVSQWRYRPYLLNGKPISVQTNITVRFKMP